MRRFAGLTVGKRGITGRHAMFGRPLVIPKALDRSQCEHILGLWDDSQSSPGDMEHSSANYKRRCQMMPVDYHSPIATLLEPALEACLSEIRHHFLCKMSSFGEIWQYCQYRRGDAFDWHLDAGPGEPSTRKISLVLQLSKPLAYRGGDLEFCPDFQRPEQRAQGTLIAFPAFYAHRVTRVVAGSRYSLVGWIHGRPFE